MIEIKLQECRVELQEMKLKKSGENKFAHFKYFELGDFIPQVNKMFYDKKMFSNFSIMGDIATLTITDAEETNSSQTFSSNIADANVKGCTAIQSLGAVHTYLKRYLYLNALEIVESDILDPNVGKLETKDKKSKEKVACNIDDHQIYITLAKISDKEELKSFYNLNKEDVSDKKSLYDAVQRRLEVIKSIDNGEVPF